MSETKIILPDGYKTPMDEAKATIDRQNKIIVALFLLLGRSMERVPINQRNQIYVTETEIAEAWKKQKSPVRLISSIEQNNVAGGVTGGMSEENETWAAIPQRVFRVVPGDLDLSKTGLELSRNMPKEIDRTAEQQKQRRVFDLE